jgi:putative addiction module component (TIGR02574 family)
MNARVDTLVEQAMALSAQERAELLDALFELVSPAEPAWEQAWTEECEDRAAAIDRGEMALFQAEEVMAKYRR